MSKRSINAFIKSTQFIGQPGKPIQPAIKYNSFLYIALDKKNQPKIGFTIGDRVLGADYTFVWSWSLPKPIIIESKVKEQLSLFSKSSQSIDEDQQKYTTETFEIDILTLIHIVRLNILVMSAWMEYIPFTKDMKYLYERLDQRRFNYITCLDATYAIKTEPVNEKNDLDLVLVGNELKRVKDANTPTPYTPVKPSNYLNVDELYGFLKLNLRKLNIQTQSNIYPKDTFVSVKPLRKEGDFYVVEYDNTAMYVDQNTLTKEQIKNLNTHLQDDIKTDTFEKKDEKDETKDEKDEEDESSNVKKYKNVDFDWIFNGPKFVQDLVWWKGRQYNSKGVNITKYVKDKQPKNLQEQFNENNKDEKKNNIYIRMLYPMEKGDPQWFYGLIVDLENNQATIWNGEITEKGELDIWDAKLNDYTWYIPKQIELDIMLFSKPTLEFYNQIKDRKDLKEKFESLKQKQTHTVYNN